MNEQDTSNETELTAFDSPPSPWDNYLGAKEDPETGEMVMDFQESPPEPAPPASQEEQDFLTDEEKAQLAQVHAAAESGATQEEKFRNWQSASTEAFQERASLRKEVEALRKQLEEVQSKTDSDAALAAAAQWEAEEEEGIQELAATLTTALDEGRITQEEYNRAIIKAASKLADRKIEQTLSTRLGQVEQFEKQLQGQSRLLEFSLQYGPTLQEDIPYLQFIQQQYTAKVGEGRSVVADHGLDAVKEAVQVLKNEAKEGAKQEPPKQPATGEAPAPGRRVVSKEELLARAVSAPEQTAGDAGADTGSVLSRKPRSMDEAIEAALDDWYSKGGPGPVPG